MKRLSLDLYMATLMLVEIRLSTIYSIDRVSFCLEAKRVIFHLMVDEESLYK